MYTEENVNFFVMECKRMLDSLHIQMGYIEKVDVSARLTSSWGICRRVRRKPDVFTISISKRLLSGTREGIMNTILHEMIHTVPGCFNHGSLWKLNADKVSKKYGYNISRTASCDDVGVEEKPQPTIKDYKYIIGCPKCNVVWGYKTKCRAVLNPEIYLCSKCRTKLQRVK